MSDILRVERAENGYVLRFDDLDDVGDEIIEHVLVIGESDKDKLQAGEELLWWIMDFFSFGGSRYDKQRLHIARRRGDKYEPPSKLDEKV